MEVIKGVFIKFFVLRGNYTVIINGRSRGKVLLCWAGCMVVRSVVDGRLTVALIGL